MTRWRVRDDEGVSLLEALVAVTIVEIVMAAVAGFFLQSMSVTGQQRGRQIAIHLADSAMEKVRALKGSAVADGREKGNEMPTIPAVDAVLLNTTPMNKRRATGTPQLPVTAEPATVAGVAYLRHWYVGACALPATGTANTNTSATDGRCEPATATGTVPMFRVVVAITWPDTNCTGDRCVFVTSTLVSGEADEPVFDEKEAAPPPVIVEPDVLIDNTVTAIDRTFEVSGDAKPLTVTGRNIPTGLVLSSNGEVTGTPTTTGRFDVTICVIDIRGRPGCESFTWFIYTPTVKDVTTLSGAPVSLQVVVADPAWGPIAWSVTGAVPAGIAFNPSTGRFSGSPTTGSLRTPLLSTPVPLVLRLTYGGDQYSEVPVNWTVVDWFVAIPSRSSALGASVDYTLPVTGGLAPITWSAVNLPAGLTLNAASGRITGRPRTRTTSNVIATARDARGQTRSASFAWKIT